MNPVAIICKKRDREPLTQGEIKAFIDGFASGQVPDYQMSALAMAILLNGMTDEEIAWLTEAMLESGTVLEWPEGPPLVDKHSTGGIGDKVSLILAPMLASCGCRVPMISGRGLGPTGGTLDKLEAIPGFRVDLSSEEMQRLVNDVGCVICSASHEIAPADRALYALRDVTGTVPSIPLITGSIMSKKLSEGLDALVLDVKVGSGAFMKTQSRAVELGQSLVSAGQRLDVATSFLITDMSQPLGHMVGNAVEVNEALDVLNGEGPEDLREVTLALGSRLLVATELVESSSAAIDLLEDRLQSGAARAKFDQMVVAQGGQLSSKCAVAKAVEIRAQRAGCLATVDAEALGYAVIELGGGRTKKEDPIDPTVGLELLVGIGDMVEPGDLIGRVFSRHDPGKVASQVQSALGFQAEKCAAPQLVQEVALR